jgi:metal transporter CNNM
VIVKSVVMDYVRLNNEQSGLNFFDLDDIAVAREGEPVDPASVLSLPFDAEGMPVPPPFERLPADPFLRQLNASGRRWVIITDPGREPRIVLNAHHFLRDVVFGHDVPRPDRYWHRPIVVTDLQKRPGNVISRLKVTRGDAGDDVIDHDLILVWRAAGAAHHHRRRLARQAAAGHRRPRPGVAPLSSSG